MSDFPRQLVLNDWLLQQFGVTQFTDLSEALHHKELSGFTEDGNSRFYVRLTEAFPQRSRRIRDEQLRDYDLNIVSHWKKISEKRNHSGQSLYPLYFQYMALLFNEIYQDRYWKDREVFCEELNAHLHSFNLNLDKKLKIEPYQPSDLNKLAFWMATGAGKTLLMHINLLQTQHYLKQHNKQREIEQVILLTPNARLSEQHQRELLDSGISADFYSKNRQSQQGTLGFGVQILHIHQLKDKDGDTTVAVGNFEGKNLVLVDEGHRGASGEEWLDKREQLCENGFSYEYSATFEQAIAAASTTKPKGEKDAPSQQQRLTQLYAKCILLDYSYRYFYNDGFGKDFHILNLESKALAESQDLYLTGCLLAFFQQRLLFQDQAVQIKPYLLDNPLCLFVGGTVTGKDLDEQQSDISLIVHFLADFLSEQKRGEFVPHLERLLHGNESLVDRQGQRVFKERFSYIVSQYHQRSAAELYQDLRSAIFNTAIGGLLHVEELKGTDGEIGLRVGDAKDYFAVINVGDTGKLCKLLEDERSQLERPHFTVSEKVFAGSLFRDINTSRSAINILIGAKKFTEGWSSWRVSTMGLLNIGKNKGSEIIQLFGRGVRLKGYDFGLQRSGFVRRDDEQQHPEFLRYLETLNIFGVRASYMDEFRQLLEDQGLSEENETRTFKLKVIPTPDKAGLQSIQLKLLRPSKSMPTFKQAARPVFGQAPDKHDIKVVLDWYPRVQSKAGGQQTDALHLQGKQHSIDLYEARFGRYQLAFLDYDQLLFEILRFKNEKSWHNLQVTREALQTLLADSTWYTLKIPPEFWVFGSKGFERVQLWQEVATVLLKRYCERFYALKKQEYEAPYLEYQTVETTDPNFVKEYQVEVPVTEKSLITLLEDAEIRLKNAKRADAVLDLKGHGDFHFIGADFHLYFPLVELSGKGHTVKVKPVHLNTGEAQFVRDLRQWVESKPDLLQGHELYLLRNQSKSGVGFFDAGNFYPDFILWLKKENRQWITFVDPKGLRNVQGLNHPKIRFAHTIKTYEDKYRDQADGQDIILNSFILSTTRKQEIQWWGHDATFADHHILFQNDLPNRYVEDMMERVLVKMASGQSRV
ncbi:DEAD/DEAH box helicase family protein [Candidatus Thiothrix anitrata]|uniref:DEAD/DEAH box helicase family protein n=1 Tax=Candidatus Thiothrix anitrata TaxID=2823902 RepID=A0ABX7X0U7_9GAMM|nr:DEAD/DEAH box helicase family protein [Candidatus Thiothrix anitrata]QTR49571.1 DEAD/DEAH box helicase family protein [Candidatus Thiothrix anitrata]